MPDAAWAGGAHEAWSIAAEGWQALLGIDGMRFDSRTNVHVGERTIIALSPKTLVDVDTGEGMTAREDRGRPSRPGPQADSPRARPRRTYWRMPPLRK